MKIGKSSIFFGTQVIKKNHERFLVFKKNDNGIQIEKKVVSKES